MSVNSIQKFFSASLVIGSVCNFSCSLLTLKRMKYRRQSICCDINIWIVSPFRLPIPLDWGGQKCVDVVRWWDNESDPELNSNVYQVARELIQRHFPGLWFNSFCLCGLLVSFMCRPFPAYLCVCTCLYNSLSVSLCNCLIVPLDKLAFDLRTLAVTWKQFELIMNGVVITNVWIFWLHHVLNAFQIFWFLKETLSCHSSVFVVHFSFLNKAKSYGYCFCHASLILLGFHVICAFSFFPRF